MTSSAEPTNAEVMASLDRTHDELVVRKELDDRWRTMVKRLVALILVTLGLLLALALSNRGLLKETRRNAQEVKDCTTPADQATECQKRLADGQRPVLKALSEDNLRASVSVGTCLRAQAPDVEACALEEFRKRSAKADAERRAAASTVPP